MTIKHIIACAMLSAAMTAGAQTYLECDFEQGIPADYVLVDKDQLTPSADMQKLGFGVGTPWIVFTPKNESGQVACSTSWYSPAGTSDDWMILPSVTISDDNVIVRWRAMASDKKHSDGYVVYIATASQQTELTDLDWQPLFTTEKEEATWKVHSVDLSAYKDQTVHIAFVNNSTDCSRLYVDDIFVGVKSDIVMKLDLIASTYRQKNVPVSGTAIYYGETELTDGFTVEYSLGQGTDYEKILVQHFPATLQPGDQMRFTLDDTFELPFHEAVTYNATITADQNRYSTEGRLTSYPRRVVCEEGTGTWCGWCVRGLVALDSLNKHCNDWTIGIAAHQGDPMANSYIEHLTYYLDSGYPAGNVCRSVRTDPGKFPSVALQVYNGIETLVAMQTEATTNFDNRTVSCSTNLWFADNYDAADFRLGYVVIENNVHVPGDSRYNQNNAYSGGKSGPMGGYENKPSPVPSDEMWYQEVARAYVDDFNGVAGSVPAQIVADETISFDKEFALPDGILNDRNCELVVMLINQTDESIVNAVKVKLRGEGEATGIEEMSQHPTTNCSEKIYDLQGRQVDAAAAKGLYIKGGRKYVCTGRK